MKPQGKVKIEWSPNFAYAIGLLTTDGNLSPNGRSMSLVSKDREQVKNFLRCLSLKNKIGLHLSGIGKKALKIQFGDVRFYEFLLSIGLMPRKSKIVGAVDIPNTHFFDFLRGHFDGDGTFYSYWDPRWKSSFMYYTELVSASEKHIYWLQKRIADLLKIQGRITKSRNNSAYRLKYAKVESLKLLAKLYYNRKVICLTRKRTRIEKALAIAKRQLLRCAGGETVYTQA